MKKSTKSYFKKLRRSHHLKLKDLAHILGIDTANLSRFESGKPYPKALVGYHILFNLSTQPTMGQVFENGYEDFIHRCFSLLEILEGSVKTTKNALRINSVNTIIKHLTKLGE